MFVVTVDFTVSEDAAGDFIALVTENARTSRDTEPGCRQFDVCIDPDEPTRVFLYELYDDRAAFDAHLRTAHFRAFDAAVAALIVGKAVRCLSRVAPEP